MGVRAGHTFFTNPEILLNLGRYSQQVCDPPAKVLLRWTGDGALSEESSVDPLQLPDELGMAQVKKKKKVILCEIQQKTLLLQQMQMEELGFIWSGFYQPFGHRRKTFVCLVIYSRLRMCRRCDVSSWPLPLLSMRVPCPEGFLWTAPSAGTGDRLEVAGNSHRLRAALA